MAKTNSTAPFSLNQEQAAAIGVFVAKDGATERLFAGEFDVGHANAIAQALILLASDIRNAARLALNNQY